jgi:carboxymethylenebutenolidase
MPIYDVQPDGEARAAVIVFQEAFGVNDHIEDVTRRFAAAGYRAVAPHLFHRTGDPRLSYTDMPPVMEQIQQLTGETLDSDVDATLAYLAEAGFPAGRVGVVGFCMGGSLTLVTAVQKPVGAAVTFYGGGVREGRFGFPALGEAAPKLQAPWLGLFGDQDKGIPVEDVEALREAAAKASVPTEVVRYPDADHGFHCDARASYHEASAKDAWKRTLDWFGKHLS